MVIGPVDLQFPVEPVSDRSLITIGLESASPPAPRAFEVVNSPDTTTDTLTLLDDNGHVVDRRRLRQKTPAWSGILPTHAVEAAIQEMASSAKPQLDTKSLVPLMLLRTWPARERVVEVLVPGRLTGSSVLFVRAAVLSSTAGQSLASYVQKALAMSGDVGRETVNELAVYEKAEKGTEIEVKVNLSGNVSVWAIITGMFEDIQAGKLTAYQTEFNNDFERRFFKNYMYEVVSPEPERGYVSLIPFPDGTYELKRKIFKHDALRRIETISPGRRIDRESFDQFLAREFAGFELRRLPPFTRTRFDINVESQASSHVYSIMGDECRVDSPRQETLRQIEIEYVRTRMHNGPAAITVDDELETVTKFVEGYLARTGISWQRTFYSKLSFLRDVTRDRDGHSAV